MVAGYMGPLDVHLAGRLFRQARIVLDHLVLAQDTAADRRARSRLLLAAARSARPGRAPGCRRDRGRHDSFTRLQGAPVIGDALELLARDDGISLTLVGRGQDAGATRRAAAANPRVTSIDWVEPETLPYLVASHDVCLGIFGDLARPCGSCRASCSRAPPPARRS